MFGALAFVPVQDVRDSFDVLCKSKFVLDNSEILNNFIDYFESTWVDRDRHPPTIKLMWWNLLYTKRRSTD